MDELAKNSFIDGLIPKIRSEVRVTHNETLSRTFDTAIKAYKRMELDQRRYGRTDDDKYSRDATFDRRAAAPRYTPPEERKARNSPRFREEPRFESNRREYEPRREPAYRRDDRHSQESYRDTQRRTDDRTHIRREEPRRREQAYPADNNRPRTPPQYAITASSRVTISTNAANGNLQTRRRRETGSPSLELRTTTGKGRSRNRSAS